MNFLLFPNPIYFLCLSSPCLPFKLENIKSWKIFSLEQFSRDWGEFFLTWLKLLAGTWSMNVLKIFGFKNRRKRNQTLGDEIYCLYYLLFICLFHGVTETVAKDFLRCSFFRMGVAIKDYKNLSERNKFSFRIVEILALFSWIFKNFNLSLKYLKKTTNLVLYLYKYIPERCFFWISSF